MAEKILNTRIALKIDTLENWNNSTLPLKKGELALATVAASAGTSLTEPVVMVKVGEDGVKTFKDLEWNFYAKAADVVAACKSEDALTAFVNGVIADAGIATDEALTALAGKVTTAEGKITTLEGKMTAVEGKAAANETAIGTLNTLVGDTAVATQIQNAIAALNLGTTYDAKGAAAQALTDAKSHAAGLNAAMDTRVQALEAIDHDHANKTELDKIATGDKAKWDAMEQNAKDYADDLDEAMDSRVAAIEAKFGDGEGNVESQIAAAVAAEKSAREAADTTLGNRVKAIEDDYLKAADKTELAGDISDNADAIAALQGLVGEEGVASQISKAVAAEAEIARAAEEANAEAIEAIEADYLKAADKQDLQDQIDLIMDNPDTANVIDSISEFTEYISTHGQIAEGFRTDIDENADEIAAIKADYLKAADKTALQGSIDGVAGRMTTAEGKITALEEASATHAKASDLTTLAGRVATAEGKVATLEGEMDTAQGDIADLQELVGEDKVVDQINAAITALKIGDYAKAADLAAAIQQHNTDKAALEAEIAKKANDADLAAVAKSGLIDDLSIGEGTVLVFDCGNATV